MSPWKAHSCQVLSSRINLGMPGPASIHMKSIVATHWPRALHRQTEQRFYCMVKASGASFTPLSASSRLLLAGFSVAKCSSVAVALFGLWKRCRHQANCSPSMSISPDTIFAAHVEQVPDLQEYGRSIPCSSAASRMYMSSAGKMTRSCTYTTRPITGLTGVQ